MTIQGDAVLFIENPVEVVMAHTHCTKFCCYYCKFLSGSGFVIPVAHYNKHLVADPGFPGGSNSKVEGSNIFLTNFPHKLDENLTEWERTSLAPP